MTPSSDGNHLGFSRAGVLLSLAVLAAASTAVTLLLQTSTPSYGAGNAMLSAQWETELALRHITSQTRFCTAILQPDSPNGSTTLELISQPDPANGNATYPVTFALVTAQDGRRQLREIDPRIGQSILIHDVQSLTFRRPHPGDPQVLEINITAGKPPNMVTRSGQWSVVSGQ